MSDDQNLGTRVRSLRRRANLSQAKLARDLGISASYLNLIEHNRRRLPVPLMFRVATVLGVDVNEFATGAAADLQGQLMEFLADPMFDNPDLKANDVRDLVEVQPGFAQAFVNLYRTFQGAREELENLGSLMLDGSAYLGVDTSRLPSEEVNDLIQRNLNHFPAIEELAEGYWERFHLSPARMYEGFTRILLDDFDTDVRVVTAGRARGVIRRYNPADRVLHLSETLAPRSRHFHMAHQIGLLALGKIADDVALDPQLTTDESRKLCRMVLANYFAGAILMPYARFHEAAEEERYDVELLGHRFRTSFEQVCHRLTTLRRRGHEGVPFHLVKADTAGNIRKRFSASGIQFARFSGGCPRWNVNQSFTTPERIRVQVSEMPDGAVYFCIARTLTTRLGGFHSTESIHAIGLGCGMEHAKRLVYSDGLDLAAAEVVPIGTNCRLCDRPHCEQRAFPSVKRPMSLDENVRQVAFFAPSAGESG